MKLYKIISLFVCLPFFLNAQEAQNLEDKRGLTYESAWAGSFRLRTDGWMVSGEYNKIKNYKNILIYQFELGEYKHPKQKRQSKDPSGGIFGGGLKPFVYGKANSLFALHFSMGQKFLLAEGAKKNGVMVYYQYMGGMTVGILKPYYVDICTELPCTYEGPSTEVTYEPGVDNGFLNYNIIKGGSGFGKGWALKFRPGLHFKTGMQFDWSAQDDFIKAIEVGVSIDGYFSRVPIMATDENRFLFYNAYLGIHLGKKR